MSIKIYYFSGTGNSLAVAKKLKKYIIDESDIHSITKFINEKSVLVDTDILGFVFPVYFMDIPDIVKEFINKLEFKTKPYIFAVATCNITCGKSLININKCLTKKKQFLSSGFIINMPGNAVVTPPEIEIERLNNYENKVAEISVSINNREVSEFEGKGNFKTNVISYLLKKIGKKLYLTPEKVSTTSDCRGCGICEKVCPLKNIKVVNNKPQWGNNCSTCLACFHWCPKKAVIAGKMLNKREQYHNREVCIEDISNF